MKTAVSIPDDIFERAERLARLRRLSRSELYATALDEYVARNAPDEVTAAMNQACGKINDSGDVVLNAAADRLLQRVEW